MRGDPRRSIVVFLSALTAVALVLTGNVSPLGWVVPVAVPIGAWLTRDHRVPGKAFEIAAQLVALIFLLGFFVSILQLRLLAGAVNLTFVVQVYYLLKPPTPLTLRRLQLVAFFQLVGFAASTTTVGFILVLLAWMALAPWAITLGALEDRCRGERRRLELPRGLVRGGLRASALCAVVAAVGFVLLPRYEAGVLRELGDRQRVSGFSDTVELGDIGRIKTSNAIVMRVRIDGPLREVPRWRGVALDHFSGRTWSLSSARRELDVTGELAEAPPEDVAVTQEYSMNARSTRTIFHVPGVTSVTSEDFSGVHRDRWENLWRWGRVRRRIHYTVVSDPARVAAQVLDDEQRTLMLQLPKVDPGVEDLAQAVAGSGPTPAAQASLVEEYLRQSNPYSLDVQDEGIADPVGHFLLTRAPGHCEYFASGMVVMLRSLGIPSRMVNGFLTGERSRFFGGFVVRQRDAHSWVEAWLPGRGWTAFDPTPPSAAVPASSGMVGRAQEVMRWFGEAWDDKIIGFNYTHQLSFYFTVREWFDLLKDSLTRLPPLGRAVGLLGLVACVVVVARVIRRRRATRRCPVPFYERALALLAARGHSRRPGQTPWELAQDVAQLGGPGGEAALELTRLYHGARYGGRTVDAGRAEELLRQLATVPAKKRRDSSLPA